MNWHRLQVATAIGVVALSLFAAAPVAAHPLLQNGRPALPDEQTFGTQHFLIHYTLSGKDSVDPQDTDHNGVPDYAELIGSTLEHVWTVEVSQMGWPPPPEDRGQGGDTRIDVYLENILGDGYAGYIETEGGYLGDNPNTPEQERQAAYAYMVLDNDFAETDTSGGETPLDLMDATIAHEFNHVLQAGIDDLDLQSWLYEATATWMEDEVYPDANDSIYYIDSLYKNPDVCLPAEIARGDDLHWYGSWLFLRYLSDKYGSQFVLQIWENMRQFSGFRALDAALATYGTSLEAEFRDFAVANLLRSYADGASYPTVRVEGETGKGTFKPTDGVQALGADYIHVKADGPLNITLDTQTSGMRLSVVGIHAGQASIIAPDEPIVNLNATRYDDVYAVVVNVSRIASERDCIFEDYTLTVGGATGPETTITADVPADQYVSPLTAAVSGNESTYRSSDMPYSGGENATSSPTELDVSFATIIPQALPASYSFDYAYVMTAADFGSSAPYYVPGGGMTANFDYLDNAGNWLSIAESPSPYDTLQAWMDDINYQSPGSIQTISGVDVLIEDLSKSDDVWFSATLIVGKMFVVVDGDHSKDDVVALVTSVIQEAQNPVPTPTGQSPTAQPTEVVPPTAQSMLPGVPNTGLAAGLSLVICGLVLCGFGLVLIVGLLALVILRRRHRQPQP